MYVCKCCGKIITEKQYKGNKEAQANKQSMGCILWLVIILCFVSLILTPIAIILLILNNRQNPTIICPYCQAKDSIIPDDTPIAKKLIEETYTHEEIENIKLHQDIQDYRLKPDNKTLWIVLGAIVIAYFVAVIIMASVS